MNVKKTSILAEKSNDIASMTNSCLVLKTSHMTEYMTKPFNPN